MKQAYRQPKKWSARKTLIFNDNGVIMIFYATLKKIRYGRLKQSLLFCSHRLIHGYNYIFDVKIKLSNLPKAGSVVFIKNKSYMVSIHGGGKETKDNGKTWRNTLSLIKINSSSIPKFGYHGYTFSCDVEQNHKSHYCPCELRGALV